MLQGEQQRQPARQQRQGGPGQERGLELQWGMEQEWQLHLQPVRQRRQAVLVQRLELELEV